MTAAQRDWPGFLVALGFAGLGGYAVSGSLGMTPMGAIFPRTVGGILVVLAAIQAARCLFGQGGASELEEGVDGGSRTRRLVVGGVMIGWAFLFPPIGFIVTSLAAVLILMLVAEFNPVPLRRRLLRTGLAAIMVGLFYWLMVSVLYIPMPQSLLI